MVYPGVTQVASPFEPAAFATVATPVLEEFQVANAVRSCFVLFENVPLAVNCCVDPAVREEARGVTAMEINVAGVTVKMVDPCMLPIVAVIVVVPVVTGVTKPFDPAALLIAATDSADEPQVTSVVRFCVEPSEYVPFALNCWVVPIAMLGLDGVIVKETSVAGVTVRVVLPEMLPNVAVIVVAPTVMGVADTFKPTAFLIAAVELEEELQVTDAVIFWVELSEYIPVAMNS